MIKSKSPTGFTFMEILAVLALMAVVLFVSVNYFFSRTLTLKEEAKDLTQAIQAVYIQTIRSGQVHRLSFTENNTEYLVERFQLPPPPPTPEQEEEYEEWLEEQEEKRRELANLSREERRARTQIDQGEFIEIKRQEFEEPVQLSEIFLGGVEEVVEGTERFLMFYPTGEMSHALIILDGGDGQFYSLATNSLSGRVTALAGRLPPQNWRENKLEIE